MTLGIIVGNRGFFPGHLARTGRQDMIAALTAKGIKAVCLEESDSQHGAVETYQEAAKCAELFKKHREEISGIIVTLPNFGDERAIANTLRLADLRVPVLVQATPDAPSRMTITDRRDSFCGKMSACNNLAQYGIPYSLTTLHTEAPNSETFQKIEAARAMQEHFLAAILFAKAGMKEEARKELDAVAVLNPGSDLVKEIASGLDR